MQSLYRIPLRVLRKLYHIFMPHIKRITKPTKWYNLRSFEPISRVFGFDRGTPIDRIYQEDFLQTYASYIKGNVCEIAEDTYTKKFGHNILQSHILHYTNDNKKATIVGDLTKFHDLPKNFLDCFICTVTLNFIYEYKKAIEGIYHMLLGGGVALVTVAGIVQVSRHDYDNWGDYWRFMEMGIKRDFEEIFGIGNVETIVYGNLLALMAEFQGIAAEELTLEEIMHKDLEYPIIIGIFAKKQEL
ncbi:MAG: hypothetical protein SOT27_03550 [Helicobacter sp.]|uniref:hypothetical protein n=1 Tax=Helicobacter sp. TaxID=218 RepID=UPI002A7C9E54|nr:hypothetical protein [Helicobacter sp.]